MLVTVMLLSFLEVVFDFCKLNDHEIYHILRVSVSKFFYGLNYSINNQVVQTIRGNVGFCIRRFFTIYN